MTPDSDYVCPQCGPAPEGPDEHARRMHEWPPEDLRPLLEAEAESDERNAE